MTPSLLRMAGDERLARMVTSGNDGAFSALYDRYHDVLVRYCRSLVRDDQDALDAFQSTMLNALRALREDRRRAPVRPWLFRIAHNESISVLRRRPASEPLDDRQIGTVDVHRTAEDREALAGLLEDLGSLTEHQRGALLLRELGGLAYEDVANALETTPLAARQAVFAARASLHDQREGRELPCAMVQRRLSDVDRRASRTRAVRAHLRGCDDCRGFASAIGRRRRAAVLVPIPPAFASGGLLTSILDASGGAGVVGGGAVASGLVAKAAVALSAAVVATGAAERGGSVVHRATGAAATAEAKAETSKPKATAAAASPGASVQIARAPTTTTAPASTRSVAQKTGGKNEDDSEAPNLSDDREPISLAAHDGEEERDGGGDARAWGDGHRGGSYGDGTRFPRSGGAGAGAGPSASDQSSRPIAARPRRPSGTGAVTPMAATTTTTSTPATEAETDTTPATTTTSETTTPTTTITTPSTTPPAAADPAETTTTPTAATTAPAAPETATTEADPTPE
ncbi:RNA polymerase sigma factor [Baekduia sp. Peel2402]|uniref:RNA polymerase sigma factor n=1 Tax=Baekduia sp. Peel2402 TaxID=3458296 RepID=UPI00403E6B3F